MASLITFENNNPPVEQGVLLMYNADNEVVAINVSDTSCQSTKHANSLSVLQYITVNTVKIEILTITPKSGYYHFTTVPTKLTPDYPLDTCTPISLVPLKEGIDFTYNPYNALLGNSEELRRYNGVFEVDYKSTATGSFKPSNLQAILSGSAVVAEVQESNYTSVGLKNSHYDGSKTDKNEYGISAALTGTPFDGSVYLTTAQNNYICSQSFDERKIELYIFTGNEDSPIVGSEIFEFNGNQIVPLRNRKVWIRDTSDIILTDSDGIVSSILTTCSI